LSLIEAAIAANERQKTRMVVKIEQVKGGVAGKTIAVLGLSFKPDADDMAPSLTICSGLVQRGARLRVWDPVAM
jgi:UDPglucose 6-dehydrogenase